MTGAPFFGSSAGRFIFGPQVVFEVLHQVGVGRLPAAARRRTRGTNGQNAVDVGDRVAGSGALSFLDGGMDAARIVTGHFQPAADHGPGDAFALPHGDKRSRSIEPELIANSLRRIDSNRLRNGGNARSVSYGTLIYI
jgi:hypothetical protein